MRPQSIEVHVERLVLHGVPAGNRDRIAAAVADELARALGDAGVPAAWSQAMHSDHVDAGSFHAPLRLPPEAFGAAVARSVLEGSGR